MLELQILMFAEAECVACEESKPRVSFLNYKSSGAFYGTKCRACRDEEALLPINKKACPGCNKQRLLDAFMLDADKDDVIATFCRTCRRGCNRTLSKGRWEIEGFTSVPSKKGSSHPRVECELCNLIFDRRQVRSHRCLPIQ